MGATASSFRGQIIGYASAEESFFARFDAAEQNFSLILASSPSQVLPLDAGQDDNWLTIYDFSELNGGRQTIAINLYHYASRQLFTYRSQPNATNFVQAVPTLGDWILLGGQDLVRLINPITGGKRLLLPGRRRQLWSQFLGGPMSAPKFSDSGPVLWLLKEAMPAQAPANCELCQRWTELPDRPDNGYDTIYWHEPGWYAGDRQQLCAALAARLAPAGELLIQTRLSPSTRLRGRPAREAQAAATYINAFHALLEPDKMAAVGQAGVGEVAGGGRFGDRLFRDRSHRNRAEIPAGTHSS